MYLHVYRRAARVHMLYLIFVDDLRVECREVGRYASGRRKTFALALTLSIRRGAFEV